MNELHEYYDEDDEPIEGYCMRCRETVEMEHPQPVWTRRGMPATRGECPDCGGTVFRMGMSAAHENKERPDAVQVGSSRRTKLTQDTAYINYSESDSALAEQLADDLRKAGIATWLHDPDSHVDWAGGVHPALKECARMVLVLSPAALADESVTAAWRFFKEKGKRIVIAQVSPAEPPDLIRRSPRFDFMGDYKAQFRQMVGALSG